MKQKMNEQIELAESTKSRSCSQKGGSSEGRHFLRIGLQKRPVLLYACNSDLNKELNTVCGPI